MPFSFKHTVPVSPDADHEEVALAFVSAEQEWHEQAGQYAIEQGIPMADYNPIVVSTEVVESDEDGDYLIPVITVKGTIGEARE